MHQVTKLVKVGDLNPAERVLRGLADLPDTAEVPIVVGDLVPESKPEPVQKPLRVPDGYRLVESVPAEPSSDEPSSDVSCRNQVTTDVLLNPLAR